MLRTYGGRIINQQLNRRIASKRELRDGIVWQVLDNFCLVKIQGTDQQIKAYYNENVGSQPEWVKVGNAVRISTPGGNKGRVEIVGHGQLLPTAVPGGNTTPEPTPSGDRILSGLEIYARTGGMSVTVNTGQYVIDNVTYTLGAPLMDDATLTMDLPDMVMDEGIGQVVTFDAAHATLFRVDIVCVDENNAAIVVKGDNAASDPTIPDTPVDTIRLAWVFIYPGMTEITVAWLNRNWSESAPASMEVVVTDDLLTPGQNSTNITIRIKDQYGLYITSAFLLSWHLVFLTPELTYINYNGTHYETTADDKSFSSSISMEFVRDPSAIGDAFIIYIESQSGTAGIAQIEMT